MKNKKQTIWMILWLVLAAVCLIYGMIVGAVGSGTLFFVVWLGLGFVFILFAIAAKIGLWGKLPKVLRRLVIGMGCVGLLFFGVVEACILSGFCQRGEKNLDYIIVLGAQVYQNGPSAVLKFRLDEAIEYLNENPDTICIVSGGQGYNEPFAEALGMAAYLEENGIADERIILETESENTEQNIINSMKLMEEEASVGIVTNDFHVFRAVQIAKEQGLENVCAIAAESKKFYLPNNMLREFLAVIKFVIF